MKKCIISVLILLILVGLSACGQKAVSSDSAIPQLMEPVGVQMDVVEAQTGEIYKAVTYTGEMIPHVEELQFTVDGTLEELRVVLGESVKEGQVLASLSDETIIEQIEELDEEIEDIIKMGEYSDRQMLADIEIVKIELARLMEGSGFTQAYRLKEIDLQKLEKSLEHGVELRQLELQEKQRVRKVLQEKLENNEIIAPFDGRVVYIRDVSYQENIQEYTTLMCLADESRLYLETEYLSESIVADADKIYARIGDKEYDIKYIPIDQDEYVAKMLNQEEVKTQFLVEAEAGELASGQFAVIVLMDSYKQNVLTIPINALFQDASGRYVYKVTGENRVRCNVSVGTISNTKVEITEGLKEGDLVYVKD